MARLEALGGGWAAELGQGGVRAGERVALMSSNRPEFIVAVLAIWRLGAAAVLLSPAWKHGDVEHALSITKPADAVGDHQVLAGLMAMRPLDDPITPGHGPFPQPDPQPDTLLGFSQGHTQLT